MAASTSLVMAADRSLSEEAASAALTTYSAIALARLDNDDPGLSPALYDWCQALMICHLRATGDPATGLKGYSSGDYSETRDPGQTTWLIQYRQIIDDYQGGGPPEADDVTRADASMDDLKFDQADIPSYYTGGL